MDLSEDLSEEALVRIPVGVAGEAAPGIPPAPAGPHITASFSSSALACEHAETLTLLGYRVVGAETRGAAADGESPPAVHLLVPRSAREDHPAWWRQLTALADRAHSLAFGPVQLRFRDVLRAHLGPPR